MKVWITQLRTAIMVLSSGLSLVGRGLNLLVGLMRSISIYKMEGRELVDNNPKCVIVHCSYTEDSAESKVDISDVAKWHKERGFRDVGYHYFVRRDGLLQMGRPLNMRGAHTKAKGMNHDSVGLCYEGTKFPTLAQLDTMFNVFRNLSQIYSIPLHKWYGHYEFVGPDCECPGFDMEIFRDLLRKLA